MKRILQLARISCLFLLFTQLAFSQVRLLGSGKSSAQPSSRVAFKAVSDFKSYKVYNTFNSFNEGDSKISLKVSGSDVVFDKTYSYHNANGYFVWSGINRAKEEHVLLLKKGSRISGIINSGNRIVEIKTDGANVIIGERKSLASNDLCDTEPELMENNNNGDDIILPIEEDDDNDIRDILIPIPRQNNQPVALQRSNSGIRVFKLLIAYTPQFASWFSSQDQINDHLELSVELINQTYITNDTGIRARLAFSYRTTDSETGTKGGDLTRFVYRGYGGGPGGPPHAPEFDEVFDYEQKYNIEASLLYVNTSYGGRADRDARKAVVSRTASLGNLTPAHEIGHMFGLEHDEDQFSWIERNFGGLNYKKAYGYVGNSSRTVMAYGTNIRRPQYSDMFYNFPEGDRAGDSYARGHYYLKTHLSKILRKADRSREILSNILISGTQMYHGYATDRIETSNYTVNANARVRLRAGNRIKMKNGTKFRKGSSVSIRPESSVTFNRAAVSDNFKASTPLPLAKKERDEPNTEKNIETFYHVYSNNGKVYLKFNFPEKTEINLAVTDIQSGYTYVQETVQVEAYGTLMYDLSNRKLGDLAVVNLVIDRLIKSSKKIKL